MSYMNVIDGIYECVIGYDQMLSAFRWLQKICLDTDLWKIEFIDYDKVHFNIHDKNIATLFMLTWGT